MVHGITDNELSELELANIREQQVAALGGGHMGHHELAAYRGGFPPGEHCIATPAELRDRLENGEIDVIFSPICQAKEALDRVLGPSLSPMPKLSDAFGSSASTQKPEVENIAALINTPTRGPM